MPVCPACDNRQFVNKEALLQHLKSSSAPHPVCVLCDRRFVSEVAFNAHMADKHPPTYDCTVCNRPFHAPFALEDHYRGSSVHPNCVRCGRGFKDDAACEEHHRTAHPKIPCIECGGVLFYEDAMEIHYSESDRHPSCDVCHNGFKDSISYAEHFASAHEEQQCRLCEETFETTEAIQTHFWTSQNHPKCLECALGFRDMESEISHRETVHKPLPITDNVAAQSPNKALVDMVSQPSTTALEHPKPDSPMYSEGLMSVSPPKKIHSLIMMGERRIESPDLHLRTDFTSPLTEVKPPVFSPTSLPRPADNIERFWNSRENIQIKSPRMDNATDPNNFNHSHFYHQADPGPSTSRSSLIAFDPVQPPSRFREGSQDNSLGQLPTAQLSPPRPDLRSRLYPGSVRHAIRTASLTRPALSTYSQSDNGDAWNFSDAQSHRSFGITNGSLRSSFRQDRGSGSSDHFVNWKELMGRNNAPRASLFSETLSPGAGTSQSLSPLRSAAQVNLIPSPSLATISSPASSGAGRSFGSVRNDPETRPTTASSTSTLPNLPNPTYTVTPSSDCLSPRSPEVFSPAGLGVLPAISPLASTPIDLITFDIPEAQKPLPESPIETAAASPVTVILDLSLQEPVSIPAAPSPLSASSTNSYITSPQEPLDTIETNLTTVGTQTAETFPVTPTGCLANVCDDITASMCGHIFCNRYALLHLLFFN
ncbi:hypothetical protein CPB84DRAFT_223925 [Gymnopilus junonius]|uniref:C2H2-type domain-containing protein n=1 Tax=Gymnopilus junonius TaxID=109634 RepID=A0A9P5NEY5_GYMJU|nr:hypothetical protein CPB84DRAFT_223925 [Gymnopilus junonius]